MVLSERINQLGHPETILKRIWLHAITSTVGEICPTDQIGVHIVPKSGRFQSVMVPLRPWTANYCENILEALEESELKVEDLVAARKFSVIFTHVH